MEERIPKTIAATSASKAPITTDIATSDLHYKTNGKKTRSTKHVDEKLTELLRDNSKTDSPSLGGTTEEVLKAAGNYSGDSVASMIVSLVRIITPILSFMPFAPNYWKQRRQLLSEHKIAKIYLMGFGLTLGVLLPFFAFFYMYYYPHVSELNGKAQALLRNGDNVGAMGYYK